MQDRNKILNYFDPITKSSDQGNDDYDDYDDHNYDHDYDDYYYDD